MGKYKVLESTVTSSIIRYIERQERSHAVKIISSAKSRNNPDIFAVVEGTPIVIESKREKDGSYGITIGQGYELLRWDRAGAIILVAPTLRDVQTVVERIKKTKPLT